MSFRRLSLPAVCALLLYHSAAASAAEGPALSLPDAPPILKKPADDHICLKLSSTDAAAAVETIIRAETFAADGRHAKAAAEFQQAL